MELSFSPCQCPELDLVVAVDNAHIHYIGVSEFRINLGIVVHDLIIGQGLVEIVQFQNILVPCMVHKFPCNCRYFHY